MKRIGSLLVMMVFTTQSALFAASFSFPSVLPGENQSINIVGSTVKIKGLTDQANSVFVNGRQVSVQRDGTFSEDMIIPLGSTDVTVEAIDPKGAKSSYHKTIVAKENSLFLAGIADGTLNFINANEGRDLYRDNQNFGDGRSVDGKISYYLAGKVKGKYLIKSSLDTDKRSQDKLFTNIDPDKYYPIYGDNSTVVYDTHSQGKFYALVEWDKSGFVIGNYQTQIGGEESRLSNYNRTLYGTKLHLETPERTVYGDTKSQATGFLAEANQFRGHSELQATGGSLYYLRHRNIVEGSEQVRLEIRDKSTGMTLQTLPQAENVDYEIKYDEGRILFKKPVMSVSGSDTVITDSVQEGNDVYVIANYEYDDQDAFSTVSQNPETISGGGRVSHQVMDNLRVGGTYTQEEKEGKNHALSGIDSTVKIGNFTKINAEYAETSSDSASSYVSYNGGYDYTETAVANGSKGVATNLSLNTSVGEYFGMGKEFLDLTAYYRSIDRNFSPADTLFESGTRKYGAELAHRLGVSDKLRFIYEDGELDHEAFSVNEAAKNELEAARIQNLTAQWVHDYQKFTFFTEYRIQQKKNSFSSYVDTNQESSGNVIAEKVEYRMSEKTSLFLGQQVGLTESKDSFTSVGIIQKLMNDIAAYLRGSVGPDSNGVVTGLDRQVNASTTQYMNYSILETALDGNSSTTAFGANTQIAEKAELRREKRFVSSDTRGIYTSDFSSLKNQITPHLDFDFSYERREEAIDGNLKGSTPRDAFSTTLAYAKPDVLKANSKFEYRVDTGDVWQVLSDNQGEYKLTQDWFLFGEYEYSLGQDTTREIAVSRIDKKQMGLAYRPVDYDSFNWLLKYTRLQDDRPRDLVSADGGFLKQKSTYNEFATEAARDLPWHFQFVEKIAYRTEKFIAVNVNNIIETPSNLDAFLVIHRLNYHLTNKVDIAGEFRALTLVGSDVDTREYGPLVEFTYQIHKNIALGAGYNFTSFKDDLSVYDRKEAEGFFLRVQGKY